jgi:ribosomal protein L29
MPSDETKDRIEELQENQQENEKELAALNVQAAEEDLEEAKDKQEDLEDD